MRLHLGGWVLEVRLRRRRTWEYFRAALSTGAAIVCRSLCLYCGRPTTHEVCHAHSEELNPGWLAPDTDIDELWGTSPGEPEVCVTPECPAWAPEEAERLRARQAKETVLL